MTDQIKRISKEAAIDIWKSQCAAFVKSFRNNCYRMGGALISSTPSRSSTGD